MRPTWSDIDLSAIAHNVRLLTELAQPAELCAVVKADAYGHGMIPVARTAVDAGATTLAVALVDEGVHLREAGIDTPILLLSEPRPNEFAQVVEFGLIPTVYQGVGLAAAAAAAAAANQRLPVHLKVDTGMARVGAPPAEVMMLADAIADRDTLELAGVWTHCAVADEPDNPFTAYQIEQFNHLLSRLRLASHHDFSRHLANSAVAMAHPAGRFDMVRCGIAIYGIPPSPALAGCLPLQPAMTLRTEVAMVKTIAAGTPVSYGHHYTTPADTQLATIPIGYADGWTRRLGMTGGEVLIGGHRRPIAGVVTMDQTMVDCGLDYPVSPGDEVILLGRQGDDEITATEIAERLDTVAYEVVCNLGRRVTLRYQ
ncbi:alanine racemase [Candidatus Poriferisocius sp.]|uniref:alanine racemase n=1 Tax=Candidatus Poriferisocius sp. TaxID=3101276 RepID=UPI003B012B31